MVHACGPKRRTEPYKRRQQHIARAKPEQQRKRQGTHRTEPGGYMTYATAGTDISMRQKSTARHHQTQTENLQGIVMRKKQQSRAARNEQQIQF